MLGICCAGDLELSLPSCPTRPKLWHWLSCDLHCPFPLGCAGDLKLSLPSRLSAGTVKAAAWQVLAEVGPEGMHLEDICR
jgi:hypothetical protein